MSEDIDRPLRREEASDAVGELGWRLVLGALCGYVRAESLARAAEIASGIVAAAAADNHIRLDLRPDRVILAVRPPADGPVTARDVAIAGRISDHLAGLGLVVEPVAGARSVQAVEIAIDAMDIPLIRPFWRAILGYVDEEPESPNGLVDPLGQGPAFWFQQMDGPRPQRNRIHVDVSVPHDEVATRIRQTLAAGGARRWDRAPSFWVLADPEGNEACVTTWQGRD